MNKLVRNGLVVATMSVSINAFANFSSFTIEDCNQNTAEVIIKFSDISIFEVAAFPKMYTMFHSQEGIWHETETQKTKRGSPEYNFSIPSYNGYPIDKFALMLKNKDGGDSYIAIKSCQAEY